MQPGVTKGIVDVYQASVERDYGTLERKLQADALWNEQRIAEELALAAYNVCPRPLPEMGPLQAGLIIARMRDVLSLYFFDERQMRAVQCALGVVLHTFSGPNTSPERVRAWLGEGETRVIGEPSASGIALLASLRNTDAGFVVKAPRNQLTGISDLIHETVVGFRLNPLREKVPNFAYVFGGFRCGPPYLATAPQNKVLSWCEHTSANSVQYVIYESITPSSSLKSYVERCTFTAFLGLYLQVLLALELAYRETGFTHYDLHAGNVLVRRLPAPVSLVYPTAAGPRYMMTGEIATIIDFGMSRVVLGDGRSVGVFGFEKYGIFPDKGFPLFDAYKLLLMSMQAMRAAGNTECFLGAAKILRFFNSTEPADSVVVAQGVNYYAIPNDPIYTRFSLYDLLNFMAADGTLPVLLSATPPPAPLFSCLADAVVPARCLSYSDALVSIGMGALGLPMTLYDLYASYVDTADPALRTALLARNRNLYLSSATRISDALATRHNALTTRCGQFLAAFPPGNGLPPAKPLVDELVLCSSEVSEQMFAVDVLSLFAELYADPRTMTVSAQLRTLLAQLKVQFVTPATNALIVFASRADVSPELRAVYSEALRTML